MAQPKNTCGHRNGLVVLHREGLDTAHEESKTCRCGPAVQCAVCRAELGEAGIPGKGRTVHVWPAWADLRRSGGH